MLIKHFLLFRQLATGMKYKYLENGKFGQELTKRLT